MTYCFYAAICLCLIIFQATIIPYISIFAGCYDLLSMFVIYLALYRPARESMPVILFSGFVMDNISGGPLCFYIMSYFWLFLWVKAAIKLLDMNNRFFLLFIVVFGVLLENLILFGVAAILETDSQFSGASAVRTVSVQVLWAILTGPFFLMFFSKLHNGWNKFKGLIAGDNG